MRSRLSPRAWSKSNSSNDFRDGNRAARMRPSPPWDSRAETSRCRHAARNSSWLQDSARARSASRADGLAQRRRFQRPGQKAELGGQIARGLGGCVVLAAITPPAHRGRAQGGVVVSQPALLDLGVAATGRSDAEPLAAQLPGGREMRGIGDRLVPRPDAVMVGDDRRRRRRPGPAPGRRSPRCGVRSRPGAPSSRCRPGGRSDHAATGVECRHPRPGGTGGSASIAARSASIRSAGRTPAPGAGGVGHRTNHCCN